MKTPKSCKFPVVAGAILFGALATLPVLAQTYPTIFQALSPVDWWQFDETTQSPAINTVSNLGSAGITGTGYVVSAGYSVTGSNGIVGNGVYLSNPGDATGICYTRIDIPNNAALNPPPPFTFEFWAKPNSPFTGGDSTGLCPVSSDSPFGSGAYDGARSGYLIYATPTDWEFRLGGQESYTAVVTANMTVSTNSWTYVVGEFDGTTASLFINGVLAASAPASGGPFHPNNWVPTRIGGTSLGGDDNEEYGDAYGYEPLEAGSRGWDGWFDEFAVYNTLLSTNVIMSHYMAGTNNSTPAVYDALILASSPVGYWNFDEPAFTSNSPSYTVAADSGSLGDTGTNTFGTLADQPGVPGTGDNSVFFNGTIGSLVLDTNIAPPNVTGVPLTLAAWIKPFSFGYVSDIIAQGYDETTYSENFLRMGDSFDWEAFSDDASGGNYNTNLQNNVPCYEIGAYDGGPGYVSAVFPAPAGDLGNWVFLVGTFDGTNWDLYRNANLVGQFPGAWSDGNTNAGPATVVETSTGAPIPWSVGSRSYPSEYFGFFFPGWIAEAAILTNALDLATISNLYNSVPLPPVITQAPLAPSPAYLGSSATFSVWADGPGTLSYQWSYNGGALAGVTGTNYSISNLTVAANGTYSVVVTNVYGSVTSSAVLVVTATLPPATLVPAVEERWLGFPLSFAPATLPNQQLSFQWNFDGVPITGATNSSYTAPATSLTAGTYTLVLTNSFGVSTSSMSTLSILTAPDAYVSTVLGDKPLAYLRLDETNGDTAFDFAGGNNGEYFGNIQLGVPGYSLIDTDTAAYFPGTAASYVGDIGSTNINFYGTNAEFSIEAWANGPSIQVGDAAVVAKGHSDNGTSANEQFALIDDNGAYGFFVRDQKANGVEAKGRVGPDGNWHHLVGVCDYAGLGGPAGLTLYVDGVSVATASLPGVLVSSGIINSQDAVDIGAESSGPDPTFDLAYNGTISQVAIYPTNLSAVQVFNHYSAAYGPNLAPFFTSLPASITNYVSLPVTLSASAAGTVPLNYQWNFAGSPIAGATSSSLTISNLDYSDAGLYTVGVTNTLTGGVIAGILSAPVTVTVLAPPSNPPPISGLVMHLTFDNTLVDATGRGNDATNEASGTATLITNNYVPGMLGQAFTYQTTTDPTTNANYASLGNRPDLQFGADTSFTVSMWVQLPANYVGNDLPFFCDVVGSTFSYPGFCFEPTFGTTEGTTAGWAGGWGFSVYSTTGVGEGVYGDVGSINDGNWHNLVYIIDRLNGATVFLDGKVAHQNVQEGATVVGIGSVSTTNIACIGQDPTGLYPQPGTGSIDDLGVWRKALSPLEAASIYMAAVSNQLSFVGVPLTFNLQVLPGPQLQLTWDAGTLQSATSLSGPWTDVAGVTSPYTTSASAAQQFFRVHL